MPLVNFLRLFSVFSLAVLNISFSALPVDALAVDRGHIGRSPNHAHAGLAKRNGSSARCRPRPTSTSTSTGSSTSPALGTPTYTPHTTTTTTTTTTTSHPSTSSTPNNLSKFGISWSNMVERSIRNVITAESPTRLVFDWHYQGYDGILTLPSNAIYMASVPNAAVNWEDVVSTLQKADSYARLIRPFNEPNIESQSNMPPGEACGLIKQYLLPLRSSHGYEIITPAVTTDSTGMAWLKTFFSLNCGTTILDLHYYGITGSGFVSSIQSFSSFGRKIIVTEFGAMDYEHNVPATHAQYVDVFNGVMQECQTNAQIYACFQFGWFSAAVPGGLSDDNRLLEECPNDSTDCGPSAHGWQYLSY
ncbi:glycosyl hydrolase catalytic core-domain-containing protein [Russula dissimulans]|nr:glycosyl hydrolase catalytic core-domain-containing protein [Russula dissimulans]